MLSFGTGMVGGSAAWLGSGDAVAGDWEAAWGACAVGRAVVLIRANTAWLEVAPGLVLVDVG